MGSVNGKRFDVKSVAIIGAGPVGLTAAKQLLGQCVFERVVIFEQQAEVGGVWYHHKHKDVPAGGLHVPSEDPHGPPDTPATAGPGDDPAAPLFVTPMYDFLYTNIPKLVMKYSDLDFPESGTIFPWRQTVQDYLVHYAGEIRDLIKFSTQVKDIQLIGDGGRDRWDILSESLIDGIQTRSTFDAVVVANGHYSIPYIPGIQNIKDFNEAHPGVITHSKYFTSTAPYAGKKVIVVGNSASGQDVAGQINAVCRKPALLSAPEEHPTPPEVLVFIGCEEVPVIEEFLVKERGVRLRGGRVEEDVDAIVFATGYLYGFPFLESLKPSLVIDGRQVHGLWKDLFHIEHPTLVFPGLPMKVSPFPVSESQAAIFARAWANALTLPSAEEMKRWEEDESQARPKAHVWPKGADMTFINETYDWVMRSASAGKTPPRWEGEACWQREHYTEQKFKFDTTGRVAESMDELGFHYRPDESEQEGVA